LVVDAAVMFVVLVVPLGSINLLAA